MNGTYDLTPLAPGERTELSFPDDYCYGPEDLPGLFAEGNTEGFDLDAGDTVFATPLRALRCGLLAPEAEAATLAARASDPALADDIAAVMSLARFLRFHSYLGACSSRFAPLLFTPPESGLAQLPALRAALDVRAHNIQTSPLDASSFRTILENGRDVERADGTVSANDVEQPAPAELDAQRRELARLLEPFSVKAEIQLGMRENDFPDFHIVPIFFIGLTSNGRVGGLMCAFED